MSNIKINPKMLELEAKRFNDTYVLEVKNIIDSIEKSINLIAKDWKGSAAGIHIPKAYAAANDINYVGKVVNNIAKNIGAAAKHAADRDERAAGGQGKSWEVSGQIDNYVLNVCNRETVDNESSLTITGASVHFANEIQKQIDLLSPLVERVQKEFETIISNAGWDSGYDNIKEYLYTNINNAKTKVNELAAVLNDVVAKIKESHDYIMKDATISGESSVGPGPIEMEQ